MKMSLRPPALVVVIALTGRLGQLSCAAAGAAMAAAQSAANSSVAGFMSVLCLSRIPMVVSRRRRSGAPLIQEPIVTVVILL